MEFNIRDRVQIVPYDELPAELKNKAIAKACGKEGEIIDRLYSEAEGGYIYKILLDGSRSVSTINFTEEMLEEVSGGGQYRDRNHYRKKSRYYSNVPRRRGNSTSPRTYLQRRNRRNRSSSFLRSEKTLLVV